MVIESDQLTQMTYDCFVSMLDIPLTAAPKQRGEICEDALQASVQIDGSWHAELRVIASQKLAEAIASAMFEIEVSDLQGEETRDALGEVANVIGGNIKGVNDHDCNLSLPLVEKGLVELPGTGVCEAFECSGETLHIVYLENE